MNILNEILIKTTTRIFADVSKSISNLQWKNKRKRKAVAAEGKEGREVKSHSVITIKTKSYWLVQASAHWPREGNWEGWRTYTHAYASLMEDKWAWKSREEGGTYFVNQTVNWVPLLQTICESHLQMAWFSTRWPLE